MRTCPQSNLLQSNVLPRLFLRALELDHGDVSGTFLDQKKNGTTDVKQLSSPHQVS